MIETMYDFLRTFILKTIPDTLFGVKAKGEPVKEPTFRTIYPENPISEYEWYQEFRVGCLHNVQQRVYFETK